VPLNDTPPSWGGGLRNTSKVRFLGRIAKLAPLLSSLAVRELFHIGENCIEVGLFVPRKLAACVGFIGQKLATTKAPKVVLSRALPFETACRWLAYDLEKDL
jgi:hypothetical protein